MLADFAGVTSQNDDSWGIRGLRRPLVGVGNSEVESQRVLCGHQMYIT
jgi:hypothetical protein